MKKVLIITLSLAVTLTAQVSRMDKRDLKPTEKALKETILSDNNGVQNSGLFVLAQLKSKVPERNLEQFNALLKNIANFDDDATVRQNANLTFAFINSPMLPKKIKVEMEDNPNKFFSLLDRELKQDFLVYSE